MLFITWCSERAQARLDGRSLDEVHPIWSEAAYIPYSGTDRSVFTRGETQALATVTLETKLDE